MDTGCNAMGGQPARPVQFCASISFPGVGGRSLLWERRIKSDLSKFMACFEEEQLTLGKRNSDFSHLLWSSESVEKQKNSTHSEKLCF